MHDVSEPRLRIAPLERRARALLLGALLCSGACGGQTIDVSPSGGGGRSGVGASGAAGQFVRADPPPVTPGVPETQAEACETLSIQVQSTLETYCSTCHNPTAAAGVGTTFVNVTDLPALKYTSSSLILDGKPVMMVVPGDPDGSRLYQRAAIARDMPKRYPARPVPAPTLSDLSVLQAWILSCDG